VYKAKISGTGSYLPDRVLSNFDLEKLVETSDAWITERTGIRERRVAAPEQATSDLAVIAAKRALEAAGLDAKDLDMIICATATPDQPMPNTACVIQEKLGARNVMAFDLAAACSGFVYALAIANQFIRSGVYKHILVVGAETLSRIVNYKDRDTCILFGDGAGVFVISRNEDNTPSEIMSEHLHADGTLGHVFELPGGGSRIPLTHAALDNNLQYVKMKGKEIFKAAVRTLVESSQEALDKNQVTIEELSWLVPHQANIRILGSVASHFGIPMEKVVINIERTGNTSAATIPMAFDEAVRDGRIKRGQIILLAAFGAGVTSGSILLRY
jgi:3-oxoacyl-[acyl-carrier-protein] synthase-3